MKSEETMAKPLIWTWDKTFVYYIAMCLF